MPVGGKDGRKRERERERETDTDTETERAREERESGIVLGFWLKELIRAGAWGWAYRQDVLRIEVSGFWSTRVDCGSSVEEPLRLGCFSDLQSSFVLTVLGLSVAGSRNGSASQWRNLQIYNVLLLH